MIAPKDLNERQWQALRALEAADCLPWSPGKDTLRLAVLLKENNLPDLRFGSTMAALERRGLVERVLDPLEIFLILSGDYQPRRAPEFWRLTHSGWRLLEDTARFKPLVRTRPAPLAGD